MKIATTAIAQTAVVVFLLERELLLLSSNCLEMEENSIVNSKEQDILSLAAIPIATIKKEKSESEGMKEETSERKETEVTLKRKADEPLAEDDLERKKQYWEQLSAPIEIPENLSKRQKKKYIRKVLWETKWKPLKRKKEKEKNKQKKLEARQNNITLGPSRKKLKASTMASSDCKLRIVLDFSFDELMIEKDICKCLKQLSHCYCLNRRAANPLQLHVTHFCRTSRDQMARSTDYINWDVNFHAEDYLSVFAKEELVYLTSESPNVLSELDHSKVYIIGALVDHNKHKGKTLQVATEQGISHAQLPIGQYVQMNSRKVLTIDHVFQILILVSEGMPWKEAFLNVIPQRKGAVEKGGALKNCNSSVNNVDPLNNVEEVKIGGEEMLIKCEDTLEKAEVT